MCTVQNKSRNKTNRVFQRAFVQDVKIEKFPDESERNRTSECKDDKQQKHSKNTPRLFSSVS